MHFILRCVLFLLFLSINILTASGSSLQTTIETPSNSTIILKYSLQRIKEEIQALKNELSTLKKTKEPVDKKIQELISRASSISEALNHLNQNYPEILVGCSYLLPNIETKSFATRNLFEPSNVIADLTEVGELLDTFEKKMPSLIEATDDSSLKKTILLVRLASQTLLTLTIVAYIVFGIYHQTSHKHSTLARQ